MSLKAAIQSNNKEQTEYLLHNCVFGRGEVGCLLFSVNKIQDDIRALLYNSITLHEYHAGILLYEHRELRDLDPNDLQIDLENHEEVFNTLVDNDYTDDNEADGFIFVITNNIDFYFPIMKMLRSALGTNTEDMVGDLIDDVALGVFEAAYNNGRWDIIRDIVENVKPVEECEEFIDGEQCCGDFLIYAVKYKDRELAQYLLNNGHSFDDEFNEDIKNKAIS